MTKRNRVVLVTGGAIRLGRAIALELASSGCDIAVHYNSSAARAKETAREIEHFGVRAIPVRANLSRPGDCERLITKTISHFGRLDYFVGSAANFLKLPVRDTDATAWDDAMNVNARANFLLARAAADELRQRRGRVVLISDLAAHRVWRAYSAHAISKAALEMTVRVLARALAPEVSVNGVAPGTILAPADMPKKDFAKLVAEIPLRRSGTPEEIARTVRFFCQGPAFITGQILVVDGGRSLF